MRVLGVDFGGRRTGLALSDPLGVTCSPLADIEETDEERLIVRILAAAADEKVVIIVVGMPRPLGGGSNAQLEAAIAFAEHLQHDSPIPVKMWDERFTSKLAEKGRSRAGARSSRRKGERAPSGQDAVAACYMLQNYLDSRAQSTEESEP